jgi:hypothetical protein
VIERLCQHNIGPGEEVLAGHRQPKAAGQREDAAVSAYLAEHPFASAVELAEVGAAARASDPHRVPYFDLRSEWGRRRTVPTMWVIAPR